MNPLPKVPPHMAGGLFYFSGEKAIYPTSFFPVLFTP